MERYARAVHAGDLAAGKLVQLACERHLRDLDEGPARRLHFDGRAANRALEFFGFLKHSKGEWSGESFELADWQQFILGSLFGWKREDGFRRFRTAYNEVPRKNGKSTLAAAVGLYLFAADGEAGAEVYTAATKRDQARITHAEATRMVKASPSLRKLIGVFKDNLHIERNHSKYEPLGADADTLDGLNPNGLIVDELHAHKTRALWDVLETATGARRQPLMFAITTAGFDRESVCWELHDYSVKILRGLALDDTFFAFIASGDEGDDWRDPATWQKANPNFGVSVKQDDLQRKCDKARQLPGAQNAFRRLHLDEWTEQSERWMDLEAWDACAAAVDADALAGQECFAGLDLASTTDVSALVLVFAQADGTFDVLPYFWVPREAARRREKANKTRFDTWIREGLMEATEGDVIDYAVIRKRINELGQKYLMREIAFDRWNASQLTVELDGDGFTPIGFGQGFASMSAPMKELDALVLAKKIRHGGHPVLRWMASNVAVKQDAAGNLKPDKAKSSDKIDGISALVMALGRAILRPLPSVYTDRGLEAL